jgi:hypothetical protein
MKQTLVVKTEVGTFTRTTARTYNFIIVAKGIKHERLEARRLAEIKQVEKHLAECEHALATGEPGMELRKDPVARAFDLKCHQGWLQDKQYERWVASAKQDLRSLKLQGPITQDKGTWACHAWSSRIDLARKVADQLAPTYRDVRIFTLDGQPVR